MKKLLLLFLVSLSVQGLFAQKFDWVSFQPHVNQVSNASSRIVGTTVDDQGFIYTAGYYTEDIVVGGSTVVKNDVQPNTIITKWSPSGQPIAYRTYHFSGNYSNEVKDIKFDAFSNQIVVAQAAYWPGSIVTVVGSGSVSDTTFTLTNPGVNLFRFNTDLVFQKAVSPGGSFGSTNLGKMALKDGAIYTAEGNSNAINKISPQNTLSWNVTSSNLVITDITISPQDTIYVIGHLTSATATSVTLGSTTVNFGTPSNNDKVFVFKLDTAGNVVQGRYVAQLVGVENCRITTDAQGFSYIFCPYNAQLLQVGGFTLSINPQVTDAFIAKMNKDLTVNFQWVTELTDGFVLTPSSLQFHPSGKIIALGSYGAPATFGQFPMANYASGFFAQLNPANGNILYATNLGSTGATRPNGVAFVGNKYYLGGICSRSLPGHPTIVAQFGCFDEAFTGHYLACFNDTIQPLPQTNFTFIREQNKVYFNSGTTSGQFVSIDFGDGTSTTTQVNPTHIYGKGLYNAVLTTKQDCYTRNDTLKILFKGIQKVLPEKIANNQLQILFIKGGFPFASTSGLIVQLKKGASVLNAANIALTDSGTIQANFFLKNEPLGFYDVIVTATNFADTLQNGVEMVAEKNTPLTLQILGTDRVLLNRYMRYQVIVSNPGNVSQYGVPVYIITDKSNEVALISNKILTDSASNYVRTSLGGDFFHLKDSLNNDSVLVAWLMLPVVAANSSEMIEFYMRTTKLGDKTIAASLAPPIFSDSQLTTLGLRTSCDFLTDAANCVIDLIGQIPTDLTACGVAALSWGCTVGNIANDLGGTRNRNGETSKYISDAFNFAADLLGMFTCKPGGGGINSIPLGDKVEGILKNFNTVFGAIGAIANGDIPNIPVFSFTGGLAPFSIPGSCLGVFRNPPDPNAPIQWLIFKSASSLDPNDKVGPMGVTQENYFDGQSTMHYTIRFENVDTASAPAALVEVYDTLDANFYDVSTLRFTGFGFADSVYQLLNVTESYVKEIDLRPAKNTIVRFEVKFDSVANAIRWKFVSLNPASRGDVTTIDDGFLNPNVASPEGEGFVSFSIMPKANRPHLQQVSNIAKIVFDANPPIFTEPWLNTVDKVKPNSNVLPLPTVIYDSIFYIGWVGNDAHSGIMGYNVFVTINDTATILMLSNTLSDSAKIIGKFGDTFKFYTRAIDRVGNYEDAPTTPDAVVTLQQPVIISAEQQFEAQIKIYPNPATNMVMVETGVDEWVQIEIADVQGRVVKKDALLRSKNISLSEIAAGYYTVKLQSAQGAVVKRLVKE